jgi:hypothetical protein
VSKPYALVFWAVAGAGFVLGVGGTLPIWEVNVWSYRMTLWDTLLSGILRQSPLAYTVRLVYEVVALLVVGASGGFFIYFASCIAVGLKTKQPRDIPPRG